MAEQTEDIPKRTAHDMFGHLIGLKLAITEVVEELTVDGIQGHPRTVLMALRGLEARADELVNVAKYEIELGR